MFKIAVIIPFYQKKRGILSKAVESAINQKDIDSLKVIVIDDESPVPAEEEISKLVLEYPDIIDIIKQNNSGPGSARNNGLDSIPTDTEYVAFLDSDDTWSPMHLKNATCALGQGYDIYFSNYTPSDDERPYFEIKKVNLKKYAKLDNCNNEYDLGGGLFERLFIKTDISPIGTSTVVYRYTKMKRVRFQTDYSIGEDTTFFIKLAEQSDRVAFGAQIECTYGKGVNIFAGAGWGTPGMLRRSSDAVFFRKYLVSHFDLPRQQMEVQVNMVKENRIDFIKSLLHSVKHPQLFNLNVIVKHFIKDPATVKYLIPVLLHRV